MIDFYICTGRRFKGLSKNKQAKVLVETSIHCPERFRVEIICLDSSVFKCNRLHVYILDLDMSLLKWAIFSTLVKKDGSFS